MGRLSSLGTGSVYHCMRKNAPFGSGGTGLAVTLAEGAMEEIGFWVAAVAAAFVALRAQAVSAKIVGLPKAKVLTAAVTADSVTSDSLTATAVAKGVSGDCSGTCVCGTECTCSMSVEGLAKVVHVLIAPALMTAMEAAAMVTASELKKQPPALAMIVTTVALWK